MAESIVRLPGRATGVPYAHQPLCPLAPPFRQPSTWMGCPHLCWHEHAYHILFGQVYVPVGQLHEHGCACMHALVCRHVSVACVFVLLLGYVHIDDTRG